MIIRLRCLTLFLLFHFVVNAQNKDQNCAYKLTVASDYLSDFGFGLRQMVDEINSTVSLCDDNSTNAHFVFGMLGRYYAKNDQDMQLAFQRIEKAAMANHPTAAKTIGLMLKEGEGCLLNLEASEDWLKTAHKLGDHEAAYILGYYYLKGLGTIRQSYNKAILWFKKSELPMAKHWLALCQYNGLGSVENPSAALDALKENNTSNSLFLHDHYLNKEAHIHDSIVFPFIEPIENKRYAPRYMWVDNNGLGTPKLAFLLEWDWAKESVTRTSPISFTLSTNDGGQDAFSFSNEEQAIDGNAVFLGDQAAFEGFSIDIPNPHPDHKAEASLFIDIHTAQFTQTLLGEKPVVLADLEGWVANFNEPAPPLSLLLIDPWDGLLQHERDAIGQEDNKNIISNYPNTFKTDMIVRFELAQDESVRVEIYHFNQLDRYELMPTQQLKKGEHILRKDTTGWLPGVYVIQLFAGEQVYRKLIIKEY